MRRVMLVAGVATMLWSPLSESSKEHEAVAIMCAKFRAVAPAEESVTRLAASLSEGYIRTIDHSSSLRDDPFTMELFGKGFARDVVLAAREEARALAAEMFCGERRKAAYPTYPTPQEMRARMDELRGIKGSPPLRRP